MMSHGISGYTARLRVPMLLDFEPYLPHNKATPREAARLLVQRTQLAHPHLALHIVFDSGFGSFDEMQYYLDNEVVTTMSMPSSQWSWLWDMLGWECPLESGRTALVSLGEHKVLASLYHVKSDSGKFIDILTASSAFQWTRPILIEPQVFSVGERRMNDEGSFEYETKWVEGDITWQLASSFMDADGTFNIKFLEIAKEEDIKDALADLRALQLTDMCHGLSLKVSGTKEKLIKRIVKKSLEPKSDQFSWCTTLLENVVSEVAHGDTSTPGRMRRFYTNTYKSLDQFDQLWYEISYDKRDRDWRTCYIWSVLLGCVINARAAYCEDRQAMEPMKAFVRGLIDELRDFVARRNK